MRPWLGARRDLVFHVAKLGLVCPDFCPVVLALIVSVCHGVFCGGFWRER
jgi:hypothetical protein